MTTAVAAKPKRLMQNSRIFNAARKAQGFKSQEQLDGFFLYFDHTKACAECQKLGPAMPLDDGMQPTENMCEKAQALFVEYCKLS